MHIGHLWLRDWRCWEHAEVTFSPDGVTAIVGPNGRGKTNILEAVAWLATLESFRYAPSDSLIRSGTSSAVVRAETETEGRKCLIEGEVRSGRQDRVQVNRQPLRRRSDLSDVFRVTVFTPDDLDLVKGAPIQRRRFLDEFGVARFPSFYSTRMQLEKVLRQRATLLRQAVGKVSDAVAATLDVWDVQLAKIGTEVAELREGLVLELEPLVQDAYQDLAGERTPLSLTYQRSWDGDLGHALGQSRREDVRRGTNSVGPQRDDMEIGIHGMPARSRASQGEQRSIALALRLAVHRAVMAATRSCPVLLLDDVFSELDNRRSSRLLELLPEGQVLLASASALPGSTRAVGTIDVERVGRTGLASTGRDQ